MENRRQYRQNSNSERPFNRNKFQKRTDDRFSRDRQSQPRDEQFRSSNKFQPREGRVVNKDGGSFTKSDRFQPREGGFQRREGGFQKRDNRFQNRPTNKFDPRKKFDPKNNTASPWKKIVLPKVYSEMQITDGKHRGKFFKSTESPKVRPTTRRVRETLFKVISRKIRGRRFLDLCAASGAVGLEAISRGALLGTFVERSAKMCSFIRKNMETLEIKEGHGEIFEIEVLPFLKRMQKKKRFWDVVFLDPPYDTNYDEILELIGKGVCLKQNGTFVIEHHAEMFFPEKIGSLKRWRVIVEGESAISFYDRV